MSTSTGTLNWRSIYSSHVDKVAHDPSTNEFHVMWDTGRHSVYSNVTANEAAQISNSYSVGKSIHQNLKNSGKPHRYF